MPTMKATRIAALAGALFATSAITASAATVLDQSNTANSFVGFSANTLNWQQRVTAGATGTLQQIDLNFGGGVGSGDVQIYVNLGSGWQSDANDFSLAVSGASGYTSFDVSSAGISLTAGDEFMIGILGGASGNGFSGSSGNTYGAGEVWLNGSLFVVSDYDINFRTYVNSPAPVPLPAGLPLMAMGLVAFGWARGRQKA